MEAIMKKSFCLTALAFSLIVCFVWQFFLKQRKHQRSHANTRAGIFRQQ